MLPRAHPTRRLCLILCTVTLGGLVGASLPAPAESVAASSPTLAERIDEIGLPAVAALEAAQRPDGTFDDPVKGRVGGGGMPQIAWVALRQAARLQGEPARGASRSHGARWRAARTTASCCRSGRSR
jgi:hypothetical protein